jgi:AcrR family transcriptional regulator
MSNVKTALEAPRRRRRGPEEARREALVTARALLLSGGPSAVTLKAVAKEMGVTHVNLIHHFGSASGLQSALMAYMVRDLTDALGAAVSELRSDQGAPRQLVNQVFDAVDAGGAGHLAAWLALSDDMEKFEPVRAAMLEMVAAVQEKFVEGGGDPIAADELQTLIRRGMMFITLCAFGDAVIGGPLREMLGQERSVAREIVAQLLTDYLP